MQLTSPESLTLALNNLILTGAEKVDLNRKMANRARQFFRTQIRTQRDIDGNAYQQRTRRKISTHATDEERRVIGNTQNNRNMLTGFSRSLRTFANEDGFEVGIAGLAGKLAQVHNNGQQVSFTTHVNGFFNSRTSRWEGGTKVKNNYTMPKRTVIGWTPALERELFTMITERFINQMEN